MSTVIRSVNYRPKKRKLDITFQSGLTYRYLEVPPQVYDGLFHAESKGQYFNRQIKGQFHFEKRLDNSSKLW